jgi:hypothetical protein
METLVKNKDFILKFLNEELSVSVDKSSLKVVHTLLDEAKGYSQILEMGVLLGQINPQIVLEAQTGLFFLLGFQVSTRLTEIQELEKMNQS